MKAAVLAVAIRLAAIAVPGARAETGIASFYNHGTRTASGERFDPTALTAAHRTLPFGSLVRITASNGRSIVVRINDRGPFVPGRIVDLTPAGARALGFLGLIRVTIWRVQ